MDIERGKTFKYLKDKMEIPEVVKENLKTYVRIKKSILEALREQDMTIVQLAQKLNMPKHEVVFYVMTLLKFGFVETGEIDDMDEYFSYKLKK